MQNTAIFSSYHPLNQMDILWIIELPESYRPDTSFSKFWFFFAFRHLKAKRLNVYKFVGLRVCGYASN